MGKNNDDFAVGGIGGGGIIEIATDPRGFAFAEGAEDEELGVDGSC